MNSDTVWELITGAVIVAVIFMLVRPGSPAAAAVIVMSDGLSALVTTATGYTGGST
jgi:hypothetical protein